MFGADIKFLGVGIEKHVSEGIVCVIDFASEIRDKIKPRKLFNEV